MHIILLSGGSGSRLWPLSNGVRSKQFIKFFQKADGSYESMVQRMYRLIKKVDSDATVTVATSKTQVSEIKNQLGDDVNVSVEPCRRDTFAAIALACSYLHDVAHVSEEEAVVVCPVDPLVDEAYFEALKELSEITEKGEANLTLLGMEPTYPSEKYGYILPVSGDRISAVERFKEKPCAADAEKYIAQGALWNGGIFSFKLKYLLNIAESLLGTRSYSRMFETFESLEKISFDYAVVEKEKKISVLRFNGIWKDLGTWSTLTESIGNNAIGKVLGTETNKNCYVINELDLPIVCTGLENVIVAASPDGILVSDLERSSLIKPFVDQLHQEARYAEKSWGSFRVIDITSDSLTIDATLNAGHSMHYHKHEHRDEVWTVVSGEGKVTLDGKAFGVRPGDVIKLPRGVAHTILAVTDLVLIEVQIGHDISVKDKIKLD